MIPYIHTALGLTVILRHRPYTIATDAPNFTEIRRRLISDLYNEDELLEVIEALAAKLKTNKLGPNLDYRDGQIYYKNQPLTNYATDRLLSLIETGQPAEPLVNFLEKLMKNPSYRVVERLYEFLEKGSIPLTVEGNFVAYKKVRNDYRDIYSGKFDNSVGKEVRVDRNQVDEDPDQTCSHGLHVCSFDYLAHYGSCNENRVVSVEVNPTDVVAIPRDYNDAKMRCCGYLVVGEVTDYINQGEDILAADPWFGSVQATPFASLQYRVDADWGQGWENEGDYDNVSDAWTKVVELVGDEGADNARVIDTANGAVWNYND